MTSQRVTSAFDVSPACARVAVSTFSALPDATDVTFTESQADVTDAFDELTSARPDLAHGVARVLEVAYNELDDPNRQSVAVVVVDAASVHDVSAFSQIQV